MAFALSDTRIYAASFFGAVFAHSLTPPSDPNDDKTIVPPVLIAIEQGGVTSMVLDAHNVYWMTTECVLRSTGS